MHVGEAGDPERAVAMAVGKAETDAGGGLFRDRQNDGGVRRGVDNDLPAVHFLTEGGSDGETNTN